LHFNKTTSTEMNKLQSAFEIHSTKNVFMTGVSTGCNLMTDETLNMKLINDKIKTEYGKRFIPPLASSHAIKARNSV